MNLFSPSSYNFPYVYKIKIKIKKTYFIVHAFVKTDGSHVEAKICEIFINRYQDIIHYGYCKVNLLIEDCYYRVLLILKRFIMYELKLI